MTHICEKSHGFFLGYSSYTLCCQCRTRLDLDDEENEAQRGIGPSHMFIFFVEGNHPLIVLEKKSLSKYSDIFCLYNKRKYGKPLFFGKSWLG